MPTQPSRSFLNFTAILTLLGIAAGPAVGDTEMPTRQAQAADSTSSEPNHSSSAKAASASRPAANEETAQADPDDTPEMRALWDKWHEKIKMALNQQLIVTAIKHYRHRGLKSCKIACTVSKEGQISNIRILQASNDSIFDTKLVASIKELSGYPILRFPPGSKRESVENTSNLKWDMPEPMRPLIGDFGPYPNDIIGPMPGTTRPKKERTPSEDDE